MTPAVRELRAQLADHLIHAAYKLAPEHVRRRYRVMITTESAPPARAPRPPRRRRGDHARSGL